jgi:hypothetical protein
MERLLSAKKQQIFDYDQRNPFSPVVQIREEPEVEPIANVMLTPRLASD